MKTYLACVPCFLRQALEAVELVTDDPGLQERVIRAVLRRACDVDLSDPPPAMGQEIHRIVREVTGTHDPYRAAKHRFNAFALGLYPRLKQRIAGAADPLSAAIHVAAAGNIVDLGVKSGIEDAHIEDAIEDALNQRLDPADLTAFKRAVREADDILYLGDNAGEIVFDRLLIEQLVAEGVPADRITYVVRGAPIINDATREDAIEAGITELVEVIDNGSDAPGTLLPDCSPEFRERLDRADLVLSKGQGNYETLSTTGATVYLLLRVKCPVIARDIGLPLGTLVLRLR
jgi:hypothetical protein